MRCIGSSRARATHLVLVFDGDMNSYNVLKTPDECLPDNALRERQDRGSTELSTFFLGHMASAVISDPSSFVKASDAVRRNPNGPAKLSER